MTCGGIQFTYDKVYQENKDLRAKIKELENCIEQKTKNFNKMRMDSLKEIQVLREGLLMSGTSVNEETLKRKQITLGIYYFNSLDGLDPEMLTIVN